MKDLINKIKIKVEAEADKLLTIDLGNKEAIIMQKMYLKGVRDTLNMVETEFMKGK